VVCRNTKEGVRGVLPDLGESMNSDLTLFPDESFWRNIYPTSGVHILLEFTLNVLKGH
jgi:hypothetical protein